MSVWVRVPLAAQFFNFQLYVMKTIKNKKGYIVLGYNKDADKYYGYIENSFSMGVSPNRVQVYGTNFKKYDLDNAMRNYKSIQDGVYHFKKEWDTLYLKNAKLNSPNQLLWFQVRHAAERLNNIKLKNCEWKAYRVGSKYCPVEIDFSEINTNQKLNTVNKFNYRNQPFKRKSVL